MAQDNVPYLTQSYQMSIQTSILGMLWICIIDQNLSSSLFYACQEELRRLWWQKKVQPNSNNVYLINWPVSLHIKQGFYVQTVAHHVVQGQIHAPHTHTHLHPHTWPPHNQNKDMLCCHTCFNQEFQQSVWRTWTQSMRLN